MLKCREMWLNPVTKMARNAIPHTKESFSMGT
jgi:hypothetical protein